MCVVCMCICTCEGWSLITLALTAWFANKDGSAQCWETWSYGKPVKCARKMDVVVAEGGLNDI